MKLLLPKHHPNHTALATAAGLPLKAKKCDDISPCTSKPKSIKDSAAKSGASWDQFLKYLDVLPLDSRPALIFLECVAALDRKRTKAQNERSSGIVKADLWSVASLALGRC